jgi:hypothetical protein
VWYYLAHLRLECCSSAEEELALLYDLGCDSLSESGISTMALLVYVTAECRQDAETHGLIVEVERFCTRVEKTQSTSQFDPFPPPYLVKKKLGGRQGRLIADCRTVGDHAIIVFLTILTRGSRSYEEFASDPISYGNQHLRFVTDADVTRFVEKRTRIAPLPIMPDPTAAEYELLYDALSHHQDFPSDELVCEGQA